MTVKIIMYYKKNLIVQETIKDQEFYLNLKVFKEDIDEVFLEMQLPELKIYINDRILLNLLNFVK